MSYPYDRWVDIDWFLYDSFDKAKEANENAYTSAFAVLTGVGDPVETIYITTLASAVLSLVTCFNFGLGLSKSSWNYSYLFRAIYLAWLECDPLPPDKPTLIDFIEAYIEAPDDARSAHRLLLDAYQSSMYDKPFDQEYHTQWVQRFRSWT